MVISNLILQAGTARAANISPADKAIKEAIVLLETRLAKLENKEDIAKLQSVITKLKSTQESAPIKEVNIADLVDNAENYKGKTITLILTIGLGMFGDSLRDNVGSDVLFYAYGKKLERLDIIISIPKNIDVPKAVFLDKLSVTFHCKEGNLKEGNEAVSITRP